MALSIWMMEGGYGFCWCKRCLLLVGRVLDFGLGFVLISWGGEGLLVSEAKGKATALGMEIEMEQ